MNDSGGALENSRRCALQAGAFKSNFRAPQAGAWALNASTLAAVEAFRVPVGLILVQNLLACATQE
jgi:hypothetical protein